MNIQKTSHVHDLHQLTNPTFRFVVQIANISQAAFTECTVPVIEWEIEEVKEGGLNTFTHQLPGRRKGAKITLKNGVGHSGLFDWYKKSMSEQFERRDVTVTLKNSLGDTIMSWSLGGAYPIKWTGPQLKTGDNTIAIQTLEFACNEVSVVLGEIMKKETNSNQN
ncbi:MAG: phage tail protein [Chloroflexi bacterium]|nr:phage tail protein [Chloroflexota bacterium]